MINFVAMVGKVDFDVDFRKFFNFLLKNHWLCLVAVI